MHAGVRITLFFQTLLLADVRRAITHQHTEGSVSISALFYLQSLSMANAVCVHAFLLAVNCASPLPVFAQFSLDLLFPVTRVSLFGCNTRVAWAVLCNAAPKSPEDVQADLCSKAVRTLRSSSLLCVCIWNDYQREVSVGLKPEEHPL